MKTVTVKQIQKLDRVAINKFGVPSVALMENAGKAVALEIMRIEKRNPCSQVLIVCGMGNNAGDGFVIARHLINFGVKTVVVLIGAPDKLKDDARINYDILRKCRYPIKKLNKANNEFRKLIKNSGVVVDALFGVGISREITEPFSSVIDDINLYAKKVVSVDVPSGLNGTTGKIYGNCIKATYTVTFSFAKKGFLKNNGPEQCGTIKVVDIGIPKKIKEQIVGKR